MYLLTFSRKCFLLIWSVSLVKCSKWKMLYRLMAFGSVHNVFCAFFDHHPKDSHYHLREKESDVSKMAELEVLDHLFLHEHIDSRTINGPIPSWEILRGSCTLGSAKPATLKLVGKFENPLTVTPTFETAPHNQKEIPSFFLERERVGLCVQHFSFSEGCPRYWLLSYLSWSTVGT